MKSSLFRDLLEPVAHMQVSIEIRLTRALCKNTAFHSGRFSGLESLGSSAMKWRSACSCPIAAYPAIHIGFALVQILQAHGLIVQLVEVVAASHIEVRAAMEASPHQHVD